MSRYIYLTCTYCISTAHPSFLTKLEIESVSVPIQILAPEADTQLTPELKEFCNTIIPTLRLPYAYEFPPRVCNEEVIPITRCRGKDLKELRPLL